MGSKQRSESSVYIKDPYVSVLQSIAYVRLIHCNLATQHELRIRTILGDGSDFELRLHFTLEPNIDIIDDMITGQMPALGKLTARHSNRASGGHAHRDRRHDRDGGGS